MRYDKHSRVALKLPHCSKVASAVRFSFGSGAETTLSLHGCELGSIKSRIATAGTKYLAISLPSAMIFRLMMPRRHLRFGSKTPDPEFPVVATSPIKVENLSRNVNGRI